MKKISMETYVLTAVLGLALGILSGCGQLMGVKEYHNGDTHILFTTATDFTMGFGQYDTADKRKAIQPGGGYSKVRTVKVSRAGERIDED